MVLRRVEVHRPFCGHPHWFSEAVGQIEFGGDRFLSVLEPGSGRALRHAPRLSTCPTDCPRPPDRGTLGATGYPQLNEVGPLEVGRRI